MAAGDTKLRLEFRKLLSNARRDAAIFAFLTIILTPVFVALAVAVVFFFALSFVDLPLIDHFGFAHSFISGVNLCFIFMVASYFIRSINRGPQDKRDYIWITAALVLLCVLILFSYTPLAASSPAWFWTIYIFLGLSMLGCMGYVYEPKEDYYLGWIMGPFIIDNPFSIEDDIDRAHLSLGFSIAIPNLIIASYADIFGSTWLWRGLEERELASAVMLLQTLAAHETTQAQERMRAIGNMSALRIIRALVKLDMIRIERTGPRLSLKGKTFLAANCLS